MKNKLVIVITFLMYVSFFVPLLFPLTGFIFPFIVPKILLFRTLVEVMLGLYGLLLIINWQEFRPRMTIVNGAVIAFILSFAISTFTGVDPYHSFWDNHERMLGLFTILHYGLYFFILGSVLKTWTEWQKAFKIFLIAGSLVMLIGVAQKFNPDLLLNQGSSRVASTLGNPIYVGGYGLFLFFVAALLFAQEKVREWKYAEVVLGILGILGILLSGTRGTLLGLGVGVLVGVIWYAFTLKKYPRARGVVLSLVAVCIVLSAVTWVFRSSSIVQSIPGVNRVVDTSLSDVVNGPRFIAWHIAGEAFLEHPVFGWGPNNFFYAFNAHYNPRSFEFGITETWFDNAHNILMNTLAVQGGVGLLTYLVLFILTIYALCRAYRRQEISVHVLIIGSAFLISHFVHNLTVFEDPTSYLYFMVWLAFIQFSIIRSKENILQTDRTLGVFSGGVVGVVTILIVVVCNLQPARANQQTLKAIQFLSVLNPRPVALDGSDQNMFTAAQVEPIVAEVTKALEFKSPHIDDIRSDVSRGIMGSLANRAKLPASQAEQLDHIVEEALKENVHLHPLDIRNHLMLAQFYQNEPGAVQSKELLGKSKEYLEEALRLSPRRQQIIYNLAIVDLQLGDSQSASNLLEQTLRDDAKIGENYWRLAYVYATTNQLEKAVETIHAADQRGVEFSEDGQRVVNQILQAASSTSSTKK
jgi:O-antigen ligase